MKRNQELAVHALCTIVGESFVFACLPELSSREIGILQTHDPVLTFLFYDISNLNKTTFTHSPSKFEEEANLKYNFKY